MDDGTELSAAELAAAELAKAERRSFLILAVPCEMGLLIFAVVIGWYLKSPPWLHLGISIEAIGKGVVATIPLLVVLGFAYRCRIKSFVEIRRLVQEILGKPLIACGWLDLCAIALLAGISEEFLFRGVLEPSFNYWGPVVGIVVTNLLFGICHAVTPMYFAYATLTGLYLSMTLKWAPDHNLIAPITCHSLYDFIAFVTIRNSCLTQFALNREASK